MLCPLLPGIADSPSQINELVHFLVDCGVEEIFCEAVNSRGPGLKLTQKALEDRGFINEAKAVELIRQRRNWSGYALQLIQNMQACVDELFNLKMLRFLLYPNRLEPQDLAKIQQNDAGVIWL